MSGSEGDPVVVVAIREPEGSVEDFFQLHGDGSYMLLVSPGLIASLPIDPNVTVHSIIAVAGDGPPELGNDGVVAFGSASIQGVASELVVRSGHSTQSHPDTIEEVRRLLLEHAGLTGVAGGSDVEPEPEERDRP